MGSFWEREWEMRVCSGSVRKDEERRDRTGSIKRKAAREVRRAERDSDIEQRDVG